MFEFLKPKKKEDSKAFRIKMAEKLSGKAIKYCAERDENNGSDIVIGHQGSLTLRNGEFIVLSSSDIVFRCRAEEMKAWEFMSNDGAMLTGPDIEHGGKIRTVMVYYTYYIK